MTNKELLEKANKEIAKVVDYIQTNEDMFDMMNLKMYDAFYKAEDIDDFYTWCRCEYEQFIDWCTEEYIDFEKMIKRVGRTSSFYLADFIDTTNCKVDLFYTINNLLYDFFDYNFVDLTENLSIKPYGEMELEDEEVVDELEDIANGFYDYFVNKIEDAVKVYDYISYVKKNQVDLYEDFMSVYFEE